MPRLLIVHHSPTDHLRALADAAIAGARHPDIEGVDVEVRAALEATIDDVLAADAYLLGTSANFGYMSGALKHFFDTTYDATREATAKRPFGLWVHGRHDTTGAVRSVLSIAKGLDWRPVAEPVTMLGDVTDEHRAAVSELGATVAASIS